MIESFLSDFSFIKETLETEVDPRLFGRKFSSFSTEPVLFYHPAKDRIIYANDNFTQAFDYTEKDIKSWNYSIYPLLNEGDQDSFRNSLSSLVSGESELSSDANYRMVGKDKKDSYYRTRIRKLHGDYYLVQLENSMLEEKIEELNKSNRELEEFAYVASHDMQEPLRKISTFGQRLKTQFSSQLGEDGNMYLSRMLNASENMRNLIDNLLEFSKISRNKQPFEDADLNNIINKVKEDLDMRIAETNSIVSVKTPLPLIEAIPSQMRQLLFNLLQNAIKFRKKDVQLLVNINSRLLDENEKKQYQLAIATEYYLVTISDNGIGFEQQYAERIFQLFQRLEGKSEYPGTGIGLSICRKIVTSHAGLIFAESEPGKGTVFSIILTKRQ